MSATIHQSIAWLEKELEDLTVILKDKTLSLKARKQYELYKEAIQASHYKLTRVLNNRS